MVLVYDCNCLFMFILSISIGYRFDCNSVNVILIQMRSLTQLHHRSQFRMAFRAGAKRLMFQMAGLVL